MLFPIVLLTDFGLSDPYVGQMKGVIQCHAPGAPVLDLCHDVLPHNIAHASFILQSSLEHFPARAVFVCVVDPGVGSDRALLMARMQERFFLAPDNGLLSFLLDHETRWWTLRKTDAPSSSTFHGRDILAPVAARLACGTSPDDLGVSLEPRGIAPLDLPSPVVTPERISCTVVHVDRFGNCLLDLHLQPPSDGCVRWTINGHSVAPVRTYADLEPGRIGLLAGSQGVMELAMNQSSAANTLRLAPGDNVSMRRVAP